MPMVCLHKILSVKKRRNLTHKKLSKPRSALPCKENVEKSYAKIVFVLSMQLHFGESFKPQIFSSERDVTPPLSQDVTKNIKQTVVTLHLTKCCSKLCFLTSIKMGCRKKLEEAADMSFYLSFLDRQL